MSISFVASAKSSISSGSFTIPTGTTSTDFCIVICSRAGSNITGSAPAGFTLRGVATLVDDTRIRCYTGVDISGGSWTINDATDITVFTYRGSLNSPIVDVVSSGGWTEATSPSSTSLTAVNAGALLVPTYSVDTTPSGFVMRSGGGNERVYDKLSSSSGASGSITLSNSGGGNVSGMSIQIYEPPFISQSPFFRHNF